MKKIKLEIWRINVKIHQTRKETIKQNNTATTNEKESYQRLKWPTMSVDLLLCYSSDFCLVLNPEIYFIFPLIKTLGLVYPEYIWSYTHTHSHSQFMLMLSYIKLSYLLAFFIYKLPVVVIFVCWSTAGTTDI